METGGFICLRLWCWYAGYTDTSFLVLTMMHVKMNVKLPEH